MRFKLYMIAAKIKQFYHFSIARILNLFRPRNTKLFVGCLLVLLLVGILMGNSVLAEEGSVIAAVGGGVLAFVSKILAYIAYGIAYVMALIVKQIFVLLILLSTYDNFVGSVAVNKGWVIIRDLCNMMIVVLLLVYAFAMILRLESKVGDKGVLVKLLVIAILINFSKLICALMIDIAQVVMMTFVNGYAATAGANLIEGIGMRDYFSFKTEAASLSDGFQSDWFEIFANMVFTIIFLGATGIITFMIISVLALRIVMIWLLVVTSPFGFLRFIGFKFLDKYTAMWWKSFSNYLIIGPVLAFFLWLSLMVMSNTQENVLTDQITTESRLVAQESGGATQHPLESIERFLPFVISLTMLYASYEVTKQLGSGFAAATAKWATDKGKKYSGYNYSRDYVQKKAIPAIKRKVVQKGSELIGKTIARPIGGALGMAGGVLKAPIGAVRASVSSMTEAFRQSRATGGGIGAGVAAAAKSKFIRSAAEGGLSTFTEGTVGGWRKAGSRMEAIESGATNQIIEEKMKKMKTYEGPKGEKILRGILGNQGASKEERAAALQRMAEGDMLDGEQDHKSIQQIRSAYSGMSGVLDNLDKKMGAKFGHLKYDTATTAGRRDMEKAFKDKKLKLENLDPSVLSDQGVMDIASKVLKPRQMGEAIVKMVDASPTAKDAGLKVLQKRMGVANTAGDKDQVSQLQRSHAEITKDMEASFANRGVDGSGVVIPATVDQKKQAIGDYVRGLRGEELAKIDISAQLPDNKRAMARNITDRQVGDMVAVGQAGRAKEIVGELAASFKEAVTAAATSLGVPEDDPAILSDPEVQKHMIEVKAIANNPRLQGGEFTDIAKAYADKVLKARETQIKDKITKLEGQRNSAATPAEQQDFNNQIDRQREKQKNLRDEQNRVSVK